MRKDQLLQGGFEWRRGLYPAQVADGIIVPIVAMTPKRESVVVGTAFILNGRGASALCCTAAHVIEGIAEVQFPEIRRRSVLPGIFDPKPSPVLDRATLRVVYSDGKSIQPGIIDWAEWNSPTHSDVAFFKMIAQDSSDVSAFTEHHRPINRIPDVGDVVGIICFDDLSIAAAPPLAGYPEGFTLEYVLELRVGRVTRILPQGEGLSKGPSVETTIPIDHRMSGSPGVFLSPDAQVTGVFGVASRDTGDPSTPNQDQSKRGYGLIALLPIESEVTHPNGGGSVTFRRPTMSVRDAAGPAPEA